MKASPQTPPCYAVIFTSLRTDAEPEAYRRTAARMEELARGQPGFLGLESARGDDGWGITVSYWESLEAIRTWREHAEHRVAQEHGRSKWYRQYRLRICRVERELDFSSEN